MYSLVTLPSEYRLYTMSDQSSGLIVRFQIRAFIAPKYCGLAVATGRKGQNKAGKIIGNGTKAWQPCLPEALEHGCQIQLSTAPRHVQLVVHDLAAGLAAKAGLEGEVKGEE